MPFPVTEHVAASARHTTGYLACGPERGPLIVFVHGWPELSISWRHQLPHFAALGFRAVAPDMRGYGRSSVYRRHEDYALSESTQDMLELLDSLGRETAVFVGHDWGSPVVWSLASQHPDRCHGVANLCVPYIPDGFAPKNIIPLVDRSVYPEAEYPAGQWDYQLYLRGELRQGPLHLRSRRRRNGEGAVPRRQCGRRGPAGGDVVSAQERRLVRASPGRPRSAARRERADRARPARLR
ncbi:MAG: alpha/beta hydrolase [Caulobacteraceae bacterium]